MSATDAVQSPDLSTPFELSPEQIEDYRTSGHVMVRGLLSQSEVEYFRQAILSAVQKLNRETRPLEERDTYARAFLQIMNLWVQDEAVKPMVLSARFGRVAAQLMGVDRARLYHDQALFKESGGGPTPWHQDQHYWPLDTNNTITMWMPLVDADTSMGTMRFASGSQSEGYLGDMPISDESERLFEEFVAKKGYKIVASGAMKAGDATFHSGWTLHGAPGNTSDRTREVMTIIYYPDGTKVGSADNANRQADLKAWLPGLQPGDLAASPLNPLV
jgi:ectoine hydroxylase-related dioxygenase (phytanoyl-CoA dioxygenase family)